MLSQEAGEIIRKAAEAFSDPDGKGTSKITYELDFYDPREGGELLSQLTFKLKNPVSQKEANEIAKEIFPTLSESIANKVATNVTAAILVKQGVVKNIKENIQSSFEVSVSNDIADSVDSAKHALVRTSAGRITTTQNLRASLEVTMRENLEKVMKSARAGKGRNSPLKYRTGRFSQSAQVAVLNANPKANTISLYYKYMINPYQVFDPRHTLSPERGLASNARNPQKLIGDALLKAARNIIGKHYKVAIKQVY